MKCDIIHTLIATLSSFLMSCASNTHPNELKMRKWEVGKMGGLPIPNLALHNKFLFGILLRCNQSFERR